MRAPVIIVAIFTALMLTSSILPASAQFQQGGVDHPGSWYVGEGLKPGDRFSYKICHVDYNECAEFQLDLWIEGDITVGSETKWLAHAVAYDGNKVVTGTMELGKVAPEPTGGSDELGPYRGAFKTSVVWLSAYATKEIGDLTGKGPKAFSLPSWGKIANIGGEQILPTSLDTIRVSAGTFETVQVAWKSGGATSQVWVLDDFPFPIKASTWTHVSEGIPPQEYRFELLDYEENVSTNPFANIEATAVKQLAAGCDEHYDLTSVKKSTKDFKYTIELKYGPENPKTGCDIEWFINFKSKFDQTEFLNQVQYDILVVDDNLSPIHSQATEEGRLFLYSASGQVHRSTLVEVDPGTAHYVIWIYGLSPETIAPSPADLDYLQIDIPISDNDGKVPLPVDPTIPDWVRNNAGWWSEGQISDSDFISGIQFLINKGIMKIPTTSQGTGTGSDEIPTWVRNNAGWWSEGQISDSDFISGIQFLITKGIINIG